MKLHLVSMEQGTHIAGGNFRPDLQVTHLDSTGKRYLADVTMVDVSSTAYLTDASKIPGAAAAKAEARKTREYRSKIDGIRTKVLSAAVELSGRSGLRYSGWQWPYQQRKDGMLMASLPIVGNAEYALLRKGRRFTKRSMRFVNICEMRCQVKSRAGEMASVAAWELPVRRAAERSSGRASSSLLVEVSHAGEAAPGAWEAQRVRSAAAAPSGNGRRSDTSASD